MRALLIALALCAGPAIADPAPIVIEKQAPKGDRPAPQEGDPIIINPLKLLGLAR